MLVIYKLSEFFILAKFNCICKSKKNQHEVMKNFGNLDSNYRDIQHYSLARSKQLFEEKSKNDEVKTVRL